MEISRFVRSSAPTGQERGLQKHSLRGYEARRLLHESRTFREHNVIPDEPSFLNDYKKSRQSKISFRCLP